MVLEAWYGAFDYYILLVPTCILFEQAYIILTRAFFWLYLAACHLLSYPSTHLLGVDIYSPSVGLVEGDIYQTRPPRGDNDITYQSLSENRVCH